MSQQLAHVLIAERKAIIGLDPTRWLRRWAYAVCKASSYPDRGRCASHLGPGAHPHRLPQRVYGCGHPRANPGHRRRRLSPQARGRAHTPAHPPPGALAAAHHTLNGMPVVVHGSQNERVSQDKKYLPSDPLPWQRSCLTGDAATWLRASPPRPDIEDSRSSPQKGPGERRQLRAALTVQDASTPPRLAVRPGIHLALPQLTRPDTPRRKARAVSQGSGPSASTEVAGRVAPSGDGGPTMLVRQRLILAREVPGESSADPLHSWRPVRSDRPVPGPQKNGPGGGMDQTQTLDSHRRATGSGKNYIVSVLTP